MSSSKAPLLGPEYGVAVAVPTDKPYANGQPVPVMAVATSMNASDAPMGTPVFGGNPALANFVVDGYKDVWATVVFVLQLLVTVGVAIYNFAHGSINISVQSSNYDGVTLLLIASGITIGASLFLVCLALIFMRSAPRAFLYGGCILVLMLKIAIAIFAFTQQNTGLGIFFSIIAGINLLWFIFARRRIPFAATLLAASTKTVTRYHGTIVVSFLAVIVKVIYIAIFLCMAIPVIFGFSNGTNGTAEFVIVCVMLVGFYWTSQVIINVVHVTASGTVATWYFAGTERMPSNPSIPSVKRAMTTSFGSICVGSLMVAFLKLLHAITRYFCSRGFLGLCAICIIRILERLMEWFNVYAFTYVSIYGCDYVRAAKATWALVTNIDKLLFALFSNCMLFQVMNLLVFADSLGIGAAVWYFFNDWTVTVICFFVAAVIHIVVFRVVYGGVISLFVCFAEHPNSLLGTDPELYNEIQNGVVAARQPVC